MQQYMVPGARTLTYMELPSLVKLTGPPSSSWGHVIRSLQAPEPALSRTRRVWSPLLLLTATQPRMLKSASVSQLFTSPAQSPHSSACLAGSCRPTLHRPDWC